MNSVKFDARALALLAAVMALSVMSGRQLFMDGAYQIVSSLNDPFWYPENQPTPRRFLSQMWSNGLLRIVGVFSPRQIELAELLYGVASFGLILIGAVALARAQIAPKVKYLLIALYFGGFMVQANFIVGEVALALTMTTVVAACTLDPASDRLAWQRFAAAVLLGASYEVVAVSNLLLAYGCWRMGKAEEARVRTLLPLVLGAGAIFQIASYLWNPLPGNGGADRDPSLYLLAALLGCAILGALLAFRILRRWPVLCLAVILAALTLPWLSFFVPQAVRFRTDLFQFAYPARLATMGMVLAIAAVPLLFDPKLWRWPTMLLDWLGEGAVKDAGLCVFAAFCGLSILSSLDAAHFFSRLDAELARHPGYYHFERCAFCRNPNAENAADLGYPWVWKSYSIAISLRHRERPFTLLLNPASALDLPIPSMTTALMSAHNARLPHAAELPRQSFR